ncbi:phosphopantetheine attachment site [Coprococcus sp. CAG:782]|jgi:acyl carrier protein|uniref:acyl carrier protein n=1 Tax=Coprococcus sp. OM04-5BH TaxID=2293093 RepID=UPI00033AF264|nr:acyl carrier protein [Coprococcus sp. OM04-5BH]MEE0034786.1 acyl carrier protein [Coprococcus sp.]RHV34172.1 acyl carrier protein [Coprococcus sp. OM04-5BH]CCY54515.1 phosphopantetheine attachment site [Coprococcus sp. CAG:782]
MDKETLKSKVLKVVSDVLPEIDVDNIDMSAELTKKYGINSVSVIQIIVALEQEFGILYEDSELALGLYYDMNDLVDSVAAKVK